MDADVAVLAETQVAVAEHHFAHQVNAGPHPASNKPYGSKVVLASKHPLAVVGLVGDPELPEANFVAVDVLLPDGNPLRVVGIVVRYKEKRRYVRALPAARAACSPRSLSSRGTSTSPSPPADRSPAS